MTPGQLNLYIRAGDTYTQVLTICDAAASDPTGRTPGTPVDLTGCMAEMQIVSTYGISPRYSLSSVSATENGGIITLGGTAGTVTITIPPSDTLTINTGVYDLKIKFPDGSVHTFVGGTIFRQQEITTWI